LAQLKFGGLLTSDLAVSLIEGVYEKFFGGELISPEFSVGNLHFRKPFRLE
jgi:hypothetical protein